MLIDLISRSSEHHCVSQYFFSYIIYIRLLISTGRLSNGRSFENRMERNTIDRRKKHLVVVLQINEFQNGRETREKKYLLQGARARVCMCVCTQFAITTAIKRSTRPARFNVSIAIFTVGIACTPGEYLSMPITHPTTRFERRKLTRFLNNTRDY